MVVDYTQHFFFTAFAHNSVNVNSKLSESISYSWESIKFCWATDSKNQLFLNIRDQYYRLVYVS